MPTFVEKLQGALYGLAIGDAMGAPVEGWPPERIAACFESVRFFLPPTHGGDPASGKGNGRITDDTLMTEALIHAYNHAQQHLDAYGYERFFLPEITEIAVWLPERQQEMPILERLWWPERYPWLRLTVANAEPRSAGMGNCVNCGAAMFMLPVGAANAGDPAGAYQEATAFSAAHNESFAVEAAGVMAAAYAAALGADATQDSVLAAATGLAHDGTALALRAVLAAVDPGLSLASFIRTVRADFAPFDQRTSHSVDESPLSASSLSNIGRPSRLHAIEELPVALAALAYGQGDFVRTIQAGVFYGRDCDSIAGMAGGIFGALHGVEAIPRDLREKSDQANRRQWGRMACEFAATCESLLTQDALRMSERHRAVAVAG